MSDEYVSDAFIYMRGRELDYPTFDVDNHLYESKEALTKFLEPEYEGVVKYVELNGRTKVAFKDRISEYIPNPTFNKVALEQQFSKQDAAKIMGGNLARIMKI